MPPTPDTLSLSLSLSLSDFWDPAPPPLCSLSGPPTGWSSVPGPGVLEPQLRISQSGLMPPASTPSSEVSAELHPRGNAHQTQAHQTPAQLSKTIQPEDRGANPDLVGFLPGVNTANLHPSAKSRSGSQPWDPAKVQDPSPSPKYAKLHTFVLASPMAYRVKNLPAMEETQETRV